MGANGNMTESLRFPLFAHEESINPSRENCILTEKK